VLFRWFDKDINGLLIANLRISA